MTIHSSNSKHWDTLIVMCAAQFMVILDAAIINVALVGFVAKTGEAIKAPE